MQGGCIGIADKSQEGWPYRNRQPKAELSAAWSQEKIVGRVVALGIVRPIVAHCRHSRIITMGCRSRNRTGDVTKGAEFNKDRLPVRQSSVARFARRDPRIRHCSYPLPVECN
jgi:hypothetical protein